MTLLGKFDTYILDLSVEIRSEASLIKNKKYAYMQFIAIVLESIASRVKRAKVRQIDIVADFNYNISIKSGKRINLIAKNFKSLLKNDEFKKKSLRKRFWKPGAGRESFG